LLNDYGCAIASFDLWMLKGAYDLFVLVTIFLGFDWKPRHVILGFFKVTKTTRQALVNNLIELLDEYGLKNKIITYVKDEASNLNRLTNVLRFVVKCATLGLEESFQGTYFGHVFSKMCQYATTDDKVCKNLKYEYKICLGRFVDMHYLAKEIW
jgi:hypothetical protein